MTDLTTIWPRQFDYGSSYLHNPQVHVITPKDRAGNVSPLCLPSITLLIKVPFLLYTIPLSIWLLGQDYALLGSPEYGIWPRTPEIQNQISAFSSVLFSNKMYIQCTPTFPARQIYSLALIAVYVTKGSGIKARVLKGRSLTIQSLTYVLRGVTWTFQTAQTSSFLLTMMSSICAVQFLKSFPQTPLATFQAAPFLSLPDTVRDPHEKQHPLNGWE